MVEPTTEPKPTQKEATNQPAQQSWLVGVGWCWLVLVAVGWCSLVMLVGVRWCCWLVLVGVGCSVLRCSVLRCSVLRCSVLRCFVVSLGWVGICSGFHHTACALEPPRQKEENASTILLSFTSIRRTAYQFCNLRIYESTNLPIYQSANLLGLSHSK